MSSTAPFEWPDLIVTQRSDLGGIIHFIPDDVIVVETDDGLYMGWGSSLKRYEPGVVYRASELAALVASPPSLEELRTLHTVKQLFGLEVQAVLERPSKLWSYDEVTELWETWSIPLRERYLALRLEALQRLGIRPNDASEEHRALAASWAVERMLTGDIETAKEEAT